MKDIDIKIEGELKEIFDNAFDFAVESKQLQISFEAIIYFIVKKYLYAPEDNVESKLLYNEFSLMNPDTKIKLEKDLYSILTRVKPDDNIAETPEELINSNRIRLDYTLESIIDKIKESNRMKDILDTDPNVENKHILGAEELLLNMLTEENKEVVGTLSDKYGISLELLLDKKLKLGELKEKNNFRLKTKRITAKSEGEEQEDNNKKNEDPNNPSSNNDDLEIAGNKRSINTRKVDPNSKTPALDQFATCMTENAKNGLYDPVVGRNKEIDQIVEILCCRKKNNAILLGDPGCGKTSVVEHLAQLIANKQVPYDLRDKRIYSLDLNALVSGTQYRGQYEQRLQDIIKEVVENKDIIVFIDEMHNLIGNGSASGSGDAANVLKPYLARGEFQCIGSTTIDEYRKYIEKEGALKRRFSPVYVNEPSIQETISILTGIAETYSKFHKVSYSEEVISKCVEWSGKYINDRYFPDKAINVLDMASSIAKLRRKVDTTYVDDTRKKLNELTKEKVKAIDDGNFEAAGLLRDQTNELSKLLEIEVNKLNNSIKETISEVTLDDISSVISKLSNVPVDKIKSSDAIRVKEMKLALESKVIGQESAVEQITLALQRNILGLRDPKKPICSLLLVGKTGTGKTLIAREIAREFMGSEDNLVTISCSEYMQDWAESKLLGSAPGYIGYSDSEPRLYILKRKPYCVLLIDEVEKSSKNLYNIWLNMLEEGEITLSSGEKVSCRNAIIIFTGNVGTKSLSLKGNGIGFTQLDKEERRKSDVSTVMKEVKKEFRPEFINRLSNIIVFNSLEKDDLKKIFYLELKKLQDRLKDNNNYDLTVSDEICDFVVNKCEPEYGARSLQRLIVKHIEEEICKAMLEQDIVDKRNITVNIKDEKPNVIFS